MGVSGAHGGKYSFLHGGAIFVGQSTTAAPLAPATRCAAASGQPPVGGYGVCAPLPESARRQHGGRGDGPEDENDKIFVFFVPFFVLIML